MRYEIKTKQSGCWWASLHDGSCLLMDADGDTEAQALESLRHELEWLAGAVKEKEIDARYAESEATP